MLTGKYTNPDGSPKPSSGEQGRYEHEMMADFAKLDDRKHQAAKAVMDVAKQAGRSPAQVALAWLLQREAPVIPIVGARKLSQFQDNLAAPGLTLTSEQLKVLDDASAVDLGFPTTFYANPMVKTFTYGGTRDAILV